MGLSDIIALTQGSSMTNFLHFGILRVVACCYDEFLGIIDFPLAGLLIHQRIK